MKVFLLCLLLVVAVCAQSWDGSLLQYGKMREAIGQGQHQSRVDLKEITARPHFFGIAALAGLSGEATILDGQIVATEVSAERKLQPASSSQATLLIGSYVKAWRQVPLQEDLSYAQLEGFLARSARQLGLSEQGPFPFLVEGEFSDVRLHVIHGACPMHARLNKLELSAEVQPYEGGFSSLGGTLLGVFVENSVGNLTHPGTSVHAHLVFNDPLSGAKVTGHVEKVGIRSGASVRLPEP